MMIRTSLQTPDALDVAFQYSSSDRHACRDYKCSTDPPRQEQLAGNENHTNPEQVEQLALSVEEDIRLAIWV